MTTSQQQQQQPEPTALMGVAARFVLTNGNEYDTTSSLMTLAELIEAMQKLRDNTDGSWWYTIVDPVDQNLFSIAEIFIKAICSSAWSTDFSAFCEALELPSDTNNLHSVEMFQRFQTAATALSSISVENWNKLLQRYYRQQLKAAQQQQLRTA